MKQIAVLAVLFVVLLAAVVVKETSRPSAGSLRDQVPLQRLGPEAFTPDDVARVEIAGPGGADPFAIARNGAVWVVESAFRAPATAGDVDRLLEAVAAARGELRLDDASALAKFDLTPERASTVVLRNAAGTVLADFALGRSSGTQGAFVRPRFEGVRDGAYAVSQDLRAALGLSRTRPGDAEPEKPEAKHFHDRSLPNLALDDTVRLELETPLWKLAFEKSGAEWTPVEGGPDLPLKPSGISQLVQTLGGALTATDLVDPAQRAALGLDAPQYRVTAVLKDGKRRSAIGAADRKEKRFFVRLDTEQDPDVVYECSTWVWESLFPPGSKLFDMKTLGVKDKGLGQVRIEGTSEPFAMTRPGGDMNQPWRIVAPAWALPPKDAQLRNYVTLLNSVRPIDWYAGDEPFEVEAVVRYGDENAPVPDLTQLRIGQEAPGGTGRLAVLATDPDRIVVLAQSTVDGLLPDLLTRFEHRPLSGTVPADVTRVEVRGVGADGAGPGSFTLARGDDGTWTVSHDGADTGGDANAIASWIDDLTRVEVAERGGEDRAAQVEIAVHRGDRVTTLGVSAAADGERTLYLDGVAFVTDSDIEVPGAASLAAKETGGENPGNGAPEKQPGDAPPDDEGE